MSEESVDEAPLFDGTPGGRLRARREAAGLSLADIGARTRVPQRHLEAIEADNYAALPSITYAIGFARAYARAVGDDEVAVARDVRQAMAGSQRAPTVEYRPYQIEEPRRVAPRGLVIAGVLLVILILVVLGLWTSGVFESGTSSPAPVTEESAAPVTRAVPQAAPPPAASGPAIPANGTVVLTAADELWIRVYDADNKTLLLKTMTPGESYTVPADANQPMVRVGRPENLKVTVNGIAIPQLGPSAQMIKDVGISAAALAKRGSNPAPAAASSPRPAPSHTRRPEAEPSAAPSDAAVPPFFANPSDATGNTAP